MASGIGRGGRGAFILQTLQNPARKPGEQEENKNANPGKVPGVQGPESQGATASSSAAPLPSVPIARGRGAFLAGLLQGTQIPGASTPGGGDVGRGFGLGRGLSAMQHLLTSAGRGTPKLQTSPSISGDASSSGVEKKESPSKPLSAPSASPQKKTIDPTEPPTSRLARMGLESGPVVHKTGEFGKPTQLSANYIQLKCLNRGVYQYHVTFQPNIDSKNMRYKMVSELKSIIGSTKAFDGTILYLPIELPNKETMSQVKRHTDGALITITITLTKVVPPENCVVIYNIIFRRIMKILDMVQVGRYYYNPNTPSAVPQHKLEVWPGYITSVCRNEGGLMLLADASHRVLRTETVLEMFQTIVNRNPTAFTDVCERAIIGAVVLTRYNNKTYRIDDILWDKNPKHEFKSTTGEMIKFVDYYKKTYNKTITDNEQPLLLHRPKPKKGPGGQDQVHEAICLIPEFCHMTGLTDELRKDFKVMKDLAFHTRVTPNQRAITMKKFMSAVNGCPEAKEQLTNWGLELQSETLPIDGRQMPPETIVWGNNKTSSAGNMADWGRDAVRNVMTVVPLRNWAIIYVKNNNRCAQEYVKSMLTCCPQMGINVHDPQRIELRDDRTETVVKALREIINKTLQMVVVIFPTKREDKYSAVKKLCCVECPVPSQVIMSSTISKPDKLRSVVQKIALQINCKLGGELWALKIPMSSLMVVGIDVFHDVAKGKRSIAGFVASTNKDCTRWFSRVCFQMPGQELIDGLKLCFLSALRKFHEVNNTLPNKIMVFRDGVSDGQLQFVAGYEIEQLRTCFSQFTDYNPHMGVVVVQKRINAKIFAYGRQEMENPGPGTIVDHTITRRDWFDFYLVSQHVRQGTVSPTHYIVVHDKTELKPDHIQRLAYKMTHLYYNWPGTIRVPAPCQYAHKLAYLVGQSIHREPSPELSDRLFFL